MHSQHWETCSAPICADEEIGGIIWYPGEEVCKRRPMNHVQKVQSRINKFVDAGTFENIYDSFTYEDLLHRTKVSASSYGVKDPGRRKTRTTKAKRGI